ncbi:hypothetical protein EQ500_09615, partial [Lactobacillus sp. XV13L]|nr:hypothetical protein [Lactobacillus sp. XV13L]
MLNLVIVIIVAVILLVLAVSVISFYFQKQNNTIINQLTQQLDQFKQQNLDETIDQISDTKLSGETLHDFNQKKEHYFDITEKQ